MKLDHERLAAYNEALQFAFAAHQLSRRLPKGEADMGDQLRRAATSVTLNLAEGAGEFAKRDKARFYRMSKRSLCECAAILDLAKMIGGEGDYDAVRQNLERVTGMLVGLIRACGVEGIDGTGASGPSEQPGDKG